MSTNGLTERQQNALPYLVAGRTLKESAELAGIDRRTFYRWLEDDEFRREFNRLRREAAELAHVELKGLMLKAAWVLSDAMEDPDPRIRLKAAQTAISSHLKANELKELEDRLRRVDDALPLWAKRNSIW